MSRILELHKGDNFSLQYANSIPATSIEMPNGKNIYPRLTEVIPPVVFNKPIILINISTTVPIGRTWRYAGECNRIVSTALGDSFIEKKPLFLGRKNLLFFSDIKADYRISYLPPDWFIDANITIYQYDGSDTDEVANTIAEIEQKVDDISNYGT